MLKKIIFNSILIFIIPITVLLWIYFGIIISAETIRFFKVDEKNIYNDDKCYRSACIKGYENENWANKFFYEYTELKYIFSDYTLWKAKEYSGETINILSPENIRKTFKPNILKNDKKAFFFGGSAAWGFGAKDDLSLPSLFAKKYNIETFNQAQLAWTSSQNLIELTQLISNGKKLDYVFFFEGLNDALMLCNSKQNKMNFTSSVKDVYQEKIYPPTFKDASIDGFLKPFKSLIKVLKYKFIEDYHFKKAVNNFSKTDHNCHNDIDKNDRATNFSIQNWKQAKILTEKNGGKFFLVLQPMPYFDNTKMSHIIKLHKLAEKNTSVKLSTISFYNEITRKLKGEDFFIDTKGIFKDKYEYIHIDYGGHFLPKGYDNILDKIDSKYQF
jgi:hypothetical protein